MGEIELLVLVIGMVIFFDSHKRARKCHVPGVVESVSCVGKLRSGKENISIVGDIYTLDASLSSCDKKYHKIVGRKADIRYVKNESNIAVNTGINDTIYKSQKYIKWIWLVAWIFMLFSAGGSIGRVARRIKS